MDPEVDLLDSTDLVVAKEELVGRGRLFPPPPPLILFLIKNLPLLVHDCVKQARILPLSPSPSLQMPSWSLFWFKKSRR
jgi:hypothetical protein